MAQVSQVPAGMRDEYIQKICFSTFTAREKIVGQISRVGCALTVLESDRGWLHLGPSKSFVVAAGRGRTLNSHQSQPHPTLVLVLYNTSTDSRLANLQLASILTLLYILHLLHHGHNEFQNGLRKISNNYRETFVFQ